MFNLLEVSVTLKYLLTIQISELAYIRLSENKATQQNKNTWEYIVIGYQTYLALSLVSVNLQHAKAYQFPGPLRLAIWCMLATTFLSSLY